MGYQRQNQLNVLLVCTGCVGLSCFILLSLERLPDGKTTTHILPFGQIFGSQSTLHLWVSNTHFPHEAVSSSGNTKKGRKSVPSTCQTRPVYKSICQRTKPSHTSLILNKIHLQCSSDANVHCGRTNNRFVGSESLFYGLFNFKDKLQPVKYLLEYRKCYRKLFAAALK